VKSRYEKVLIFIGDTNMSLAKKVAHTCDLAYDNLRKGDMVQRLYREVRKMKKAGEELYEALNPVKLRPMILRTRCDLFLCNSISAILKLKKGDSSEREY